MKKQKTRITANQFDQALMEEIQHAQNMNLPANALSSCATFAVLVENRLFGQRTAQQRSAEFNSVFSKVIENAKVERFEQQQKEREQARAESSRIIVPGSPIRN